jgi:hypothetical protein
MRWIWLVAVVVVVAVATVWTGGRQIETVGGVQATTSSVVVETTIPSPAPIPFPDFQPPLPPGFSADPPGGGEVLNIHSPVTSFRPGQTFWASVGVVAITVRTDKAVPKVGEPVAFEVVVATAGSACCRVVLSPGGGASFDAGGGLMCLPDAAAGTRTATFRWVHVYETAGHFRFSVTARSGTCNEPAGTGGLTGFIEVS